MEIEMTDKSNALKLDYDETSPITGNVCVIVEADENTGAEHRMCMESGFVTRTSLVYPLPGVEGEYYTSKLDVDNALVFSNTEFEEALDKFYTIIQEHNDKD